MSAKEGRFDGLLAGLAQQHGGVESLLDSFFDFLHRRTDFYVVARDPKARGMGFLPGQAQEKVLRAFQKFPMRYLDGKAPAEGHTDGSRHSPAAAASGGASGVKKEATSTTISQESRKTAPASAAKEEIKSSPPAVQLTEEGKQGGQVGGDDEGLVGIHSLTSFFE